VAPRYRTLMLVAAVAAPLVLTAACGGSGNPGPSAAALAAAPGPAGTGVPPTPGPQAESLSETGCSGIRQPRWAFSHLIESYAGW
jgi:hypothetical protein